MRILEKGPHHVLEAVRWGPNRRRRIDDRMTGRVDARVGGVSLAAAILLVDDAQVRVRERAVMLRTRCVMICARTPGNGWSRFALEHRKRVVLRAVVHDDRFEVLVAKLQQRARGRDHSASL